MVSRAFGDCGNGHAGAVFKSAAPEEIQPTDVREIRYTPAPASKPVIPEASAVE